MLSACIALSDYALLAWSSSQPYSSDPCGCERRRSSASGSQRSYSGVGSARHVSGCSDISPATREGTSSLFAPCGDGRMLTRRFQCPMRTVTHSATAWLTGQLLGHVDDERVRALSVFDKTASVAVVCVQRRFVCGELS